MRKKRYALLGLLGLLTAGITAQEKDDWASSFYVGGGLGLHAGTMKVTGLDGERFPEKSGRTSAVYSIFVQGEFGKEGNFAVRPQLSFLTRGGSLTGIDRFNGYSDPELLDIAYRVKSHYVDFRIPLLYQFCKKTSKVRPYAGIAPVVGFATGGNISLLGEWEDRTINGFAVDANKSNLARTYFALAPTVGARFNFHVGSRGQNVMFVGVEASYQIGLSDTYGTAEKNGEARDVVNGWSFKYNGKRKFSGFELQATVGVPFSAFRRAKAAPAEPAPIVRIEEPRPAPAPTPAPQPKQEKPCYTLEEITYMIEHKESVEGKTICAVDDINFDFGKSTIKRESYKYLDRIADILLHTGMSVIVKGHTDNVGQEDFNMELSKKRAKSVVDYLVKKGIDKNRLSYEYYGASRPIKDNDTEEGRTYNRRVEFEIIK